MPEPLLTRYLQPLLAGRRAECFSVIHQALDDGREAERVLRDVVWPAMAQLERLYRSDRIDTVTDNMACRINRTVADQLQRRLPQRAPNGRRIVITCADEPREELGAQMMADLFQADGWDVYFVGGQTPEDELLALVGRLRPDGLLIFGTSPQSVPATRELVRMIREIRVAPHMNVLVSGGVFNRADGLWREVGADIFCETAEGVLTQANEMRPRDPNRVHVGVVKQRRRQRKTPPQKPVTIRE
jgi:methanogenic corrinoid protein MtbC1